MSGHLGQTDGSLRHSPPADNPDHRIMKSSRLFVRGFTLVELAIAVVIVGILAAIALPNYTDYVRKGRRADAFDAMAHIQQEQERYRSNNLTYADSFNALRTTSLSQAGHYTLSLSDVTSLGYTLTVVPTEGGKQAQDTACMKFELKVFKASSNTTATSNSCLPK